MGSKNFSECKANGGRIRVKKYKNGKEVHICFDEDGTSHAKVMRRPGEKKVSEESIEKLAEYFNQLRTR